ncbi:MAG: methyl-accepting chemotaxis protein [Ramlibacter sp.]
MKIWHKILIGPTVAILFLLALGGLSAGMMMRQAAAMDELVKVRNSALDIATSAAQEVGDVHSNVYRMFTWIENLGEDKLKSTAADQRKRIDAVLDRFKAFSERPNLLPEEKALIASLQPQLSSYRTDINTALQLSLTNAGNGKLAMEAADTGFQALLKDFGALVALQKKLSADSAARVEAEFRAALLTLVAIALIAAAVSLALALVMSRAIVRPLRSAIDVAGNIAQGDLTARLDVRGRDETAELLRALGRMQEDLRRLVGEVAGGAHTVADTSAQIAQGNLDLSQRTEDQASTLEQTASSMEELTSTVTLNAENARQASQLAVGASDVARKGGAVVGEVVTTMNGISDASRKIADIIGVIDGIAFQTNILALNAAVEAARAGEQGRGFAVVAAEVRSLAQRSAGAAKEIKTLIGDSVHQVEAGTKLVGAAGKTMEEIVAAVQKVSDLIAEIAAASREQSAGIGQVNAAVTQMEQVVQQNASLVEEASAAAESMKGQAAELLQSVARFKLDDRGPPTPPPPAAPALQPLPVPAPIRVKPAARESAVLPPAYAAMLGAADRQPAPRNGHADGSWKEF